MKKKEEEKEEEEREHNTVPHHASTHDHFPPGVLCVKVGSSRR